MHTQICGMITPSEVVDYIHYEMISGDKEKASKLLGENAWAAHSRAGTQSIDTIFEISVQHNAQNIIKKICSFPETTAIHQLNALKTAIEQNSLPGALYLLTNYNYLLKYSGFYDSLFSHFFIISLQKAMKFDLPCKEIFTTMLSYASYNMESCEFTKFTRISILSYLRIGAYFSTKLCPYKVLITEYDTLRSKSPLANPAIFFLFFKGLKTYDVFSETPLKDIISSQLYKDFYEWKPMKQLCNNIQHADIQ